MDHVSYPMSRKSSHVDTHHGIKVPDPYRWLEDLNSPETQAWIAAQNALTFDFLDKVPSRERLKQRLTMLWNFPKAHAPFKRGDIYVQLRNNGLQNQDVLYVMDDVHHKGHALLDPNTLSSDSTVALTAFTVSRDGQWLAYGISESGSDWRTWYVKDTTTGQDTNDVIQWSKFSSAAWLPGNDGFIYGRYAEPAMGTAYAGTNYNQQLFLHRLGTPQAEDILIYERPDHPTWGFDPVVTEDGHYLIIHVWEGTERRNRVFYRALEDTDVTELIPNLEAKYEFLYNQGSLFYFLTDMEAERGQVICIDIAHADRAQWRSVIPEGPDVIQHVSTAHDEFILLTLHNAHHQLKRYAFDGTYKGDINLPTLGAIVEMEGTPDGDDFFYSFSSFTYPLSVFRYHLPSGEIEILNQPSLDFDFEDYVTKQVFATSQDGTQVPLFLIHHRDITYDGMNPTLLYGYGGFNIPMTPTFAVDRLVWLEMGGVFVMANLRGGGEFGKAWHQAGSRQHKQNVFDDFIACAEWLIAHNVTSTPKLAIEGRSNGGLLIGACLTQRPDLFGAALPTVGVLDMLRFHKFTIGWAWTSDYGDPENPDDFAILYAYSPLHNVKKTKYPPTLILTGDHDDRVMPAHSYKFAAALQASQLGKAPVLIRIQTKAGHGVGKPTDILIQERADILAFLTQVLLIPYPH